MSDINWTNVSHYIPIATTLLAAWFASIILRRYDSKRHALHLLWWGIGVAVYGAGTLFEAIHALAGFSVINFKLWYISGALLGGAPLAIGSIYLHFSKKFGHTAVVILAVTVAITSVFVFLSPIHTELAAGALNGRVLGWQAIRGVSPFINSLAAIFLIGTAIYSAVQFGRRREHHNRAIGNWLIAIGAILPGIGGFYSRLGHTEVLYVGEFLGIILIWLGYYRCQVPVLQQVTDAKPAMSS